jgi:hypothetical protein
MAEPSMRRLSLDAVAAGCQAEARRPRHDEQGYCFELFRRALDERSQLAWQAIAAQYRALILSWVHAARPEEAADETADEALERFWRTLAARNEPVATRFPHTGALLRYMQQCAICAVLDARRRALRHARIAARARAEAILAPPDPSPEEQAVERAERMDRLQRARAWVAAVSDPAERLVVELSFAQGLSPAEIAARHPAQFADAQQVRQIKERVLRRARRALLDDGGEAH